MSVIFSVRFRVVVLYLSFFVCCVHAQECNRKHETVSELKDIFIGRCVDFQTTIHPEHFCSSGMRDCQDVWEKFSAPFLNNPPCNVTSDLYADFIAAAHHPITGKQLFYSGLGGFAQRYSNRGQRFTIQEDTLIGHLGDGVSFCGGDAGTDSTIPCQRWNPETCPHTASGDFWVAASKNFAQNAVGNVYVLMNATRDPIYKSTSYFNKYEVPELRTGVVNKVTLILINDSPSTKRDPCGTDDSVQVLKTTLTKKGIGFDCKENPRYFNKYEVPELRTGVVNKVTMILVNDSPSTKRDPCGTDESVQVLKTTLTEKGIVFDCKENPRDLVYLFCMDNVERDICKTNVPSLIDEGTSFRGNFALTLLLAFVNVFLRI